MSQKTKLVNWIIFLGCAMMLALAGVVFGFLAMVFSGPMPVVSVLCILVSLGSFVGAMLTAISMEQYA